MYFEKMYKSPIKIITPITFKKENPLIKEVKEQMLPIAKAKNPTTEKPYMYGFCLMFL